MARVGSSYRRQRGVKALAFQANSALSVPALPSINTLGSDDSAVKRSLTSVLKPSKDRQVHEARDFKAQQLTPRSALDHSLKKTVSGIDSKQLKKMSDLLKRELNIKFEAQDSSAPRRQPLYVTPEVAGTKRDKEVLGRSKYEASSVAEVWESAEQPDFGTKKPVFHRLKNAALLVCKIGDIAEELNKELRVVNREAPGEERLFAGSLGLLTLLPFSFIVSASVSCLGVKGPRKFMLTATSTASSKTT